MLYDIFWNAILTTVQLLQGVAKDFIGDNMTFAIGDSAQYSTVLANTGLAADYASTELAVMILASDASGAIVQHPLRTDGDDVSDKALRAFVTEFLAGQNAFTSAGEEVVILLDEGEDDSTADTGQPSPTPAAAELPPAALDGKSMDACADGWAGERCDECASGFTGDLCNKKTAQPSTTAQDGGSVNGMEESTSDCAEGWAGERCDECAAGYTGDLCSEISEAGKPTESNGVDEAQQDVEEEDYDEEAARAELQAELQDLKISQLKKLARQMGVLETTLDKADDSGDVKSGVVRSILDAEFHSHDEL